MQTSPNKNPMNKPPPAGRRRWRRAPIQVDLPLPDPDDGVDGDQDFGHGERAGVPWWQGRTAVIALAAVTALSLLWAAIAHVHVRDERAAASVLQQQLKQATLRPASTERRIRITPNVRSWSAAPDAQIRLPEPPELLELYLPVGYTQFNTFAVIVDKVDHGRLLVLQRLAADSNRDLRVGLNSSAFGAGEYRIRLQGYTWRGERVDVGWVRLVVE